MASAIIANDENDIETLLAKASNPLHRQPEPESLSAFCDLVEKERDGPQTALRLLAHKIQSPQEKESLMALMVLDESVRRCGMKFRSEVGKFRFLNEMIKVVSPKYLGNRASSRVKQKIIELMFSWSMQLKQETKIFEAYQMLKRQGVVVEDPVHVLENYEPPPPPVPRPKNAIFEDDEKSQQLQKLLCSQNPEDLQAANRLIKNMVKEADRRMEVLAKRSTELETVHNNANVLADMLNHYKPQETSLEEKELMKELFESCERLRPKLFRLAGEMDEADEGLGEILKANDELTSVISNYKKVMGITSEVADEISTTTISGSSKAEPSLLDLGSPIQEPHLQSTDPSLLDDQLLALGLNDLPGDGKHVSSESMTANSKKVSESIVDLDTIFSSGSPLITHQHTQSQQTLSLANPVHSVLNNALPPNSVNHTSVGNVASFPCIAPSTSNVSAIQQFCGGSSSQLSSVQKKVSPSAADKALEELDALGQSLLKKSLPGSGFGKVEFPNTPQRIPLCQLKQQQESGSCSPLLPHNSLTGTKNTVGCIINKAVVSEELSPSQSPSHDALILKDLFVPIETIQPGNLLPLTIHEKNGLTVVIHFGKNSPRIGTSVMVVSTMSKNVSPVRNVNFQAAVPKSMKIKLQPPSATDLPPHNPILPPAAITQVMLLANPQKDIIRFKYKINYTIENDEYTDIGEVDNLLTFR